MASTVAAPAGVSVGRPKSKYTRVAALGFAFMAAGMVLWIAAALIAGQHLGEEGFMFGGGALLAVIGAGVIRRFGTAGKAVAIVLALVPLVMMFWVAFSLFAPASFAEFSGALMFVVGGLSALGFSIASLVRRNAVMVEPAAGETRAMRVIIGVVALGVAMSAVVTVTGRTTVDAAAAQGATPVEFSSFEFAESTYTVPAGDTKMLVHNSDAFTHDFTIPALGLDPVVINPGSEQLVEFTADPGTYLLFCSLHSDVTDTEVGINMAATLVVE